MLHNEQFNVTVYSNASIVEVQFWLNGNMVNSYSQNANTTQTINVLPVYPTGDYTIRAVVNGFQSETWISLLNVENWTLETFPYNRNHKNVEYSFFGNGTLKAELNGETLSLDLSLLRNLVEIYDLDVSCFSNSMNFLVRFSKGAINVDLNFAFIYSGVKFIINGTLDQPRTFTFELENPSKWKRRFDTLRSGNLVFDFSDFKKASQAFTYENGVLSVNVPQSFSLDPTIFSDGFESGDFSEWTGTTGSPTVTSTNPHHGSYEMTINSDEYAYIEFTTTATVYTRFYVNFQTIPTSNGQYADLMAVRDGYDGTWGAIPYIYRTGAKNWLYCAKGDWSDCSDTYQWDPSTDTWYCLEVGFYQHASAGWIRVWLDGVLRIEETGLDTSGCSTDTIFMGQYDHGGTQLTMLYDCVVIDNSTYIGPETEGNEEYFYGNTTISYSSSHVKTWLFSRAGTDSLVFTTGHFNSLFFARTGGQTLSFTPDLDRAVAFLVETQGIISFAVDSFALFPMTVLYLFGSVVLGLTGDSVLTFLFSRPGVTTLIFAGDTVNFYNLFIEGVATIAFTVYGAIYILGQTFLSLFGSATLAFTSGSNLLWTFGRLGSSALSFLSGSNPLFAFSWEGVTGLIFASETGNLYSLLIEGIATITFTVSGLFQVLGATFLYLFGSANISFLVNSVATILGLELTSVEAMLFIFGFLGFIIAVSALGIAVSRKKN